MDEKEKAMALAYGWLWHVTTQDERIWKARWHLLDTLPEDIKRWGIEEAKRQGAKTNQLRG
jgi:hypothetical protein